MSTHGRVEDRRKRRVRSFWKSRGRRRQAPPMFRQFYLKVYGEESL